MMQGQNATARKRYGEVDEAGGRGPEAPEEGQAFLWDSELRGFGVRVIKSGLKTFIFQYRNAAGSSRRIKLGRFGAITVEVARDLAKIKQGLITDGKDPADETEEREPMTVAELSDWYLEEAEAGRILGRRNRPIKGSMSISAEI